VGEIDPPPAAPRRWPAEDYIRRELRFRRENHSTGHDLRHERAVVSTSRIASIPVSGNISHSTRGHRRLRSFELGRPLRLPFAGVIHYRVELAQAPVRRRRDIPRSRATWVADCASSTVWDVGVIAGECYECPPPICPNQTVRKRRTPMSAPLPRQRFPEAIQ
jgi:hypothetical protein